jgi:hypothetical protein
MLGSFVSNSLLIYYTKNNNGIYIMLLIILENLDYFLVIIKSFWPRLFLFLVMIMAEYSIYMVV